MGMSIFYRSLDYMGFLLPHGWKESLISLPNVCSVCGRMWRTAWWIFLARAIAPPRAPGLATVKKVAGRGFTRMGSVFHKNLKSAGMALRGSPSVLSDADIAAAGEKGDEELVDDPNAQAFLMDAVRHCKAVGFAGIPMLAQKAKLSPQPGVIDLSGKSGVREFISAAEAGRFWEREVER
jgi:hypothetical protein